ncbi:FxSxx-COOH system tetratricopeptide repeat protein [Streptomyces sp. NPDC006544]|uniref:FxSxx-COOH system tetratricopeptide repeat protein n=1 Tax=Streptomyces sp. NPDC006544 TaxID=3154583 RepID=UPI0033BC3BD4
MGRKKRAKRKYDVKARGPSSIAVSQNFGVASTGANAHFDMRRVAVSLDSSEPASVEGLSNLPFADTAGFVGRRLELAAMSDLHAEAVCVIHGLGGTGKTRIALERARVGVESRVATWWITADSPENLALGLAGLTSAISPSLALGLSTSEGAAWAMSWLRRTPGWLLVLDNVEEPRVIRDLVASPAGGRIIITSRRRYGWDGIGREVSLNPLSRTEAVQLLAELVGTDLDSISGPTLDAIAEELGDLPLGLVQAGSYLMQTQVSPTYYLTRLRSHAERMYRALPEGRNPERTIARIWDITLEAIAVRNPQAIKVLEVLSYFASDDLPRQILDSAFEDELDGNEALTLLASYSMIQLRPSAIDIHRLVQAVVRSKPSLSDAPTSGATRALDLMAEFVHGDVRDFRSWPKWRSLLPHIETLINHLPGDTSSEKFRYLIAETASFYSSQDQSAEAIRLRERALVASRAENDQESVFTNLANLADDYKDCGDLLKAVELAEQAVEASSQVVEGERSHLHSLMVRGAIRHSLGDNQGATEDMTAALVLVRSRPPEFISNETFVTLLGNMAAIARDAGLYDQAMKAMREALHMLEKFSIDGPILLPCLNNLAALYRDVGRPSEGLPYARKALRVSEEIYGKRHTLVIAACSNLAALYRSLQRPHDAVKLARRALEDAQALVGIDGSLTAICMNNLCSDYIRAGRYDEALPLAKEALRITESNLGDGHSSMANRLSQLAAIFYHQGRHREALPYAERAFQIAAGAVGKGHPLTISTLGNLAMNYVAIGDLAAAAWAASEGYDQALARYGPEHETTQLFKELNSG